MSSANQPNVSKLGASFMVPSSEMRPCVVRSPISPQKLAGARIEPPVSEPVAMSASLPATAAADPDDEPPVTRSGAAGFTGNGEMRILAEQREGKLVGLGLADEARAGIENHLHGRARCARRHGFRRTSGNCRNRCGSRRRRRCP